MLVLGPMDRQPPQFASIAQPARVAIGCEDGEHTLSTLLLGSVVLGVLLTLRRGVKDDGLRPLGLGVVRVDLVAEGVEVVHRQLRVVADIGRQPRVGRRPGVLAGLVTAVPQRQPLAHADQSQGRLAHREAEMPAGLRSLVLAWQMPATLASLTERVFGGRLATGSSPSGLRGGTHRKRGRW